MLPQSATSITDFKLCPTLYFLRHVLRLRPIEDAESLRMGTNWHKCLEILTLEPDNTCDCVTEGDTCYATKDCPVCEGNGVVPDDLRMVLARHMNQAYESCPPSVELTDWEVERTVLFYSAIGWQWHWQNDRVETIAREIPFDRQVNNVYRRRGIIDRIIRRNALMSLGEYKSTSKPIDSGSLYWDRLKLDSQVTLYLIEVQHAQLAGNLEAFGVSASDPLISGMLYDVWHKPTIRPKKLTQADSKKFVASGEYFGEEFEVEPGIICQSDGGFGGFEINGKTAEVILGAEPKPTKKNPDPARPFAIRETPEMFGARLLADIREQPEKHFARRDIARTDGELSRASEEFYSLARVAHIMTKQNLWFLNENHCSATYQCAFHPICYHNLNVTDGNVPDGFRCLNKRNKNARTPEATPETEAIESSTTGTPESSGCTNQKVLDRTVDRGG